ncbi:MAG: FAD-dependent oxidoreductase [Candidatus Competibacteraceae bacterium]|nr:FAD-dependent oxidoreductase [Candidatus Competibacteraceae bacterium]
MSDVLDIDITLIGGGVSGLWLLSRLRELGYGVLLVEGHSLGAGQSLRAQGLVHDPCQPAGDPVRGPSRAELSQIWQRCLEGRGEVDLRAVQRLSGVQYQWFCPPRGFRPRLFGGLRHSAFQGPGEALEREAYPPSLRHDRFRGQLYRLDEPVLDMGSLLEELARPHRQAMVLNQSHVVPAADGGLTLRVSDRDPVVVRSRRTIACAGANNGFLSQTNMQLRPAQLVMVRGSGLPDSLNLHCLEADEEGPRLSIISQRDLAGRTVWYIGGRLAEEGGRSRSERHLHRVRRQLTALLPWVDFAGSEWSNTHVDWAEPRQRHRARPTQPGVSQLNRLITVWPVTLGMVPLMAEQVLKLLRQQDFQPRYRDLSLLDHWPRPLVGVRPWDDPGRQWHR